jgi:hypothetical protein
VRGIEALDVVARIGLGKAARLRLGERRAVSAPASICESTKLVVPLSTPPTSRIGSSASDVSSARRIGIAPPTAAS